MKKFFLSLLILLFGLPILAQETTSPSPSESLDFVVNGITYTILNEQEKTCQTKAGNGSINYEDRKLVITYGNNIGGNITIPATVQKPADATSATPTTYKVVAIGTYGFDKATGITIASGGVTQISEYAFFGNTSLASITIPDDVSVIGKEAFYYCTSLKSVRLPNSLTTIDPYVFSYSGLTSISIPSSVVSIGENAFAYCSALQNITIPGTVMQLGKAAFIGCTGLKSVTLEEGLTSIPSSAFSGCNALTQLTIPSSVNSIGDHGFYCSGLNSITCLSRTIPAISSNSFFGTTYTQATLKVYKTVLSNYQKSQLWGQFIKIEPIEETALDIVISPSTLNINVGLTSRLNAVVTPADATGEVVWSLVSASPANCVEIDETGLVTAKQIGTARVSATIGSLMATCDIVVSANPDASVVINPPAGDIYIGDVITLSAVVFPTTITPNLTWSSSNPAVATIDSKTGELKALSDGATVITADNGNLSGSITLNVKPIEATSITLSQQNITLKVGASQTLEAKVLPENTTYKNVSWDSNDPNIVVVSDGVITAMGVGTANVRAMVGQLTANCTVTVVPIEAESVKLSATSADLKIGQSLQLNATVAPENTTDKTITWVSGNADCASVSTDGNVLAISQGTATITATCGVATASCIITVSPIESNEVVLNYSALSLKVGGSQQLTATIYPENTTDRNLTWTSSTPNIATVNNGLVTAVSVGTATITVTNGIHSATCAVTVDPILVEQVILDMTDITVNVGTPYTLNTSVLPENATDKTIVWTSLNEEIATVSDGVIKGVAPGAAVITASSGNANASCTVTVLQPATSIKLNESNLNLFVGDVFDLIETVTPVNTTDLVSWSSSDSSVATVDNNGIVTAVKAGNTVIKVTCGTQTASCSVTVSDIVATSVVLDSSELNLIAGQSHLLTATVLPENTTFPIVTWMSSNNGVAIVAENGTVTAVSAGTATITASCGSVNATCKVTVISPAPNEIVLNYVSYSLKAMETVKLEVISPEKINPDDVSWSSGDSKIASVSSTGMVTGVSVGETTVTATYNGVSTNCLISVIPTEAETVVLNVSELTLEINDTYQLTATVSPENTSNPFVTWNSSNPDVVTVSEEGEITALASGVSTITAMCGNVYGMCLVTVLDEGSSSIVNISLTDEEGYYRVYTLLGVNVMITKEKSDLENLNPGLYIINRRKVLIR